MSELTGTRDDATPMTTSGICSIHRAFSPARFLFCLGLRVNMIHRALEISGDMMI